jgi:hypothetical protein
MVSNKPPTLGWQLDRCDVCGNKIHRSDLVRTQVEFLDKKAENYLSYSSYDGTYWVVDSATDAGSISYGNRCDNARYAALTDSYTDTYFNCVQTWTGNGTMRMETLSPAFSATAVAVFSAQVGPHEQNTSPEMTVAVGICNSDGSSKQAIKTWTIKGTTRVYLSETAGTLEGYALGSGRQFYYYIQVTNAGNWWIDEMQLEANPTDSVPEVFVRASGSLVSNQSDRTLITSRKVCPNCVEPILSKSERFGRTDESPVDEPVDTWAQEI